MNDHEPAVSRRSSLDELELSIPARGDESDSAPGDVDQIAKVLIACARARVDPAAVGDFHDQLRAPFSWDRLLREAFEHRMLPLLADQLQHIFQVVPPDVRTTLAATTRTNGMRMLAQIGELIELLSRFESAGIPALPYKGPTIAVQLYGDAAVRQVGDIDVLVRRRDVTTVRELLLSNGYRSRHAISAGNEHFLVRSRYCEEFQSDAGRSVVEVHWAFTNGDIGFPLVFEALRPNTTPVALGGRSVPGMGLEDLLIILSVHGSKHRWDRLEWLCGFGCAVNRSADIDWDRLMFRARELGVSRMLLLALLLSHDLLGAAVPDPVLSRARASGAVSRLAREVPRFLFSPADVRNMSTDLFRFRLRERPSDRLRFVLYRLTTPSRPESWETVSIGRWQLPVHALKRPFVLAGKLLRTGRTATGPGR